jgi:phytanoyl-CoA hydroxylase
MIMERLADDLLIERFQRDGYLLVRGLADADIHTRLLERAAQALSPVQGPAEYEADVGYPGAPADRDSPGGHTVRRLLNAYSRDQVFRDWVRYGAMTSILRGLMGSNSVFVSQCHHNCVMTKHPGYGSMTMWHQDIRYWSFDRPELISVWLALGHEDKDNGSLWMIPGSHLLELDRGRLDRDLFLRPELPENEALIEQAVSVTLEPGDVVLFHCRTFHAAGQNLTDRVKLSAVFTFHTEENRPIPGTRSAQYPSIAV